jgi:hypothetical protein
MTLRMATVRTVHTSEVPGLAPAGVELGYRARPGGLGTYSHRVETVDGRPVAGLLLGFPVLGEQHARRTADLHRRLAGVSHPRPDGLAAAAVWHGTVDLPGHTGAPAVLAPDPYARNYVSLHDALTSGQLDVEPLRSRFELAHALARAVGDIAGLGAVHGGLDASTMLVRLADRSVRITELESATFETDGGHVPLGVATAAGYLAPELYDGTGEHPEAATGPADRWPLAVGIHELLTGYHPFHFLPDLSPDVVDGYLRARAWPDHHLTGATTFALRYSAALQMLPDDVCDAFRSAFQRGWHEPDARPTPGDWIRTLDRWIGDPAVDDVRVDRDHVVRGETVTVSWRTRFAHRILVNGQDVPHANGSLAVTIDRPGPVTLLAIGPGGIAQARTAPVAVLRVPNMVPVEIRVPLSRQPRAGRPGDDRLLPPQPPATRSGFSVPLPTRPVLPDPAVARLPADAPRVGGAVPPRFRRPDATPPRLHTDGRRHVKERHNP